jgi:hypothetical protein
MNEELLDSMLVKPLPKKYDKNKNTFLFAQSKDEEEFLDSKIIDETNKFSKKQYNDFMNKLGPKNQFIDKTKELELIQEKVLESLPNTYKTENTITEISLKDPLEKLVITKEDEKEKTKASIKPPLSRITEKPKILKPQDYTIDNEFIIDQEMLIGNTPIKDRIINIEKPTIKTDSYYLENRETYIKFIEELFKPYYNKLLQEEEEIKSGKIIIDCDNYKDNSFKLFTHQELITRYINLYTPYRGLLIYHGLGSGKTCSSIAIAEGLKDEMQVLVFMPASLKQNYIDELKKCGDYLYKKNQYWEFINTSKNPEYIKPLSVLLKLPENFINKNNGAWLVNASKEANYDTLTPGEQKILNEQIELMIKYKYSFISYNAPNFKTQIEAVTSVDLNDTNNNPFNNKVIIIDEAHNFISRIVNKLNISENSKSLIVKIYQKLMDAENCKIILLTGTPIINFPNEIAISCNILRGYIKTLEIKFNSVKANFNLDFFKKMLTKENVHHHIDIIDYNNKFKILKIIKNPFSFINKENNKVVYSNIKFSTLEFFTKIIDLFKSNSFDFTYKIINNLALPDGFKEFKEMFIDSNDKIINEILLKRRIVGLTSYFRSAQEQLMPKYNEDEDLEIINIEMSEHQFNVYADARIKEMTAESKKMKQLMKKNKVNDDKIYSENVSTYRLFSRLCCNFVFPDSIKRPIPSKGGTIESTLDSVADSETLDETFVDNVNIDEKIEASDNKLEDSDSPKIEKELSESKTHNYNELITKAYKQLDIEGSQYLVPESLKDLSPKFLNILENLKEPDLMGIHLLYSQFKTLEGIGIFKLVLKHNGFAEIKIKKNSSGIYELNMNESDYNKPFFACYSGDEKYEEKKIIKDILNNNYSLENPPLIIQQLQKIKPEITNNNFGGFIKLLMITSSGAEGISLKNVRYVHIMEPYWHPVRTKQVIGRARRICSHNELDKEYQNVKVFYYIMKFSEKNIKDIQDASYKELKKDKGLFDSKQIITSDEYLYQVSYKKQKITENILTNIKESSIDCNVYQNNKEDLKCFSLGKDDDEEIDYNTLTYIDDIKKQKIQQNESVIALNKSEKKMVLKQLGTTNYGVKEGTKLVYKLQTDEEKKKNIKPKFVGTLEEIEVDGKTKYKIVPPKKL